MKNVKVRDISENEFNRMLDNGWSVKYIRDETSETAYARLAEQYIAVKMYTVPTNVRGYREIVALVKGRIYHWA